MFNVLIVEDQKLAREQLENYINASEDYILVASITAAGMAELYCATHNIDLVIMDVCTEYDENGIEACAKIKKRFPKIKVIIVTSMVECSFLEKAYEAQADSFWYKDVGQIELLEVMNKTMANISIYPDKTPEVNLGFASSHDFTKTELKVLRLVVEGMSYEQMAQELNVKPRTVRFHVNNMLEKTGYTSKIRLAIAATSKKFIIPKSDSS